MYANLAALKAEFGVSGGSGGDNIDVNNVMGILSGEGPAAGPVHAFEILNAAKCSANHGLMQAIASMNTMDQCAMPLLRVLSSAVSSLSGMLGGGALSVPMGQISQLLGALTGGIQSLGCINLGIAKIHVKIQGQAQISGGAISSGVGSWVSFNTDLITRSNTVRDMVNNKSTLKEILAEKSKNFVKNTQAWHVADGVESKVRETVIRVREYVGQIDGKERQAMNTLDAILKTAHALKGLVCSILGMIRAFMAALQSVEIGIGVRGTMVAEVVQVLQAVMSILAKFLSLFTDLLNFLTSLCVEAETISVKMFTNTLSSVKEKFRELKYAPLATTGGM